MRLVTATGIQPSDQYYRCLEDGNILLFPPAPFEIPEADQALLRSTSQTAGSHHKNIAYRPAEDRVSNFQSSADADRLRSAMRGYSERALGFLRAVFPRYMEDCRVDYASFRPQEEEGRDLPLNKRNDLLHVDSFPTRPTSGDLILRLFTNINPVKSRVWMVSDPFRDLAGQYAGAAGLERVARGSLRTRAASMLHAIGLPVKNRSAYDRFMLGFHDWLKANEDYQQNTPKYRFEFAPGATWMVFTDVVPHAVLSGQYALEQTVIVRRDRLLEKEKAPIAILESICHKPLSAARP